MPQLTFDTIARCFGCRQYAVALRSQIGHLQPAGGEGDKCDSHSFLQMLMDVLITSTP